MAIPAGQQLPLPEGLTQQVAPAAQAFGGLAAVQQVEVDAMHMTPPQQLSVGSQQVLLQIWPQVEVVLLKQQALQQAFPQVTSGGVHPHTPQSKPH